MLRRALLMSSAEAEPAEFQGMNVIPKAWKDEETISDGWSKIVARCQDGTYLSKYNLGDTKIADFGIQGLCMMQIVAFDQDTLSDGSGKAPITWVSQHGLSQHSGGVTSADQYKSLLPIGLQNSLRQVHKKFTWGKNTKSEMDCYLFVLSTGEATSLGKPVRPETMYDNHVKYVGSLPDIKVTGLTPNGPNVDAWTRSRSYNNSSRCWYGNYSASLSNLGQLYVAPCFCT